MLKNAGRQNGDQYNQFCIIGNVFRRLFISSQHNYATMDAIIVLKRLIETRPKQHRIDLLFPGLYLFVMMNSEMFLD